MRHFNKVCSTNFVGDDEMPAIAKGIHSLAWLVAWKSKLTRIRAKNLVNFLKSKNGSMKLSSTIFVGNLTKPQSVSR